VGAVNAAYWIGMTKSIGVFRNSIFLLNSSIR